MRFEHVLKRCKSANLTSATCCTINFSLHLDDLQCSSLHTNCPFIRFWRHPPRVHSRALTVVYSQILIGYACSDAACWPPKNLSSFSSCWAKGTGLEGRGSIFDYASVESIIELTDVATKVELTWLLGKHTGTY